jgi:hypothetical protein
MSELTDLLERFRRGAELVALTMTGAAGAEVDYSPETGKWSVRQLVCHLADTELVVSFRFRQVIAQDAPPLITFDQDAWASRLDYAKRKPSHAIESFRRLRGENYELLKDQPEEVFARVGMHPERGPVTLLDMLKLFTNHVEKHCTHIRAAREAFKKSRQSVE